MHARRYVAWVTAAFGPFWGFQEGWWSWLSGVTDNSVYPVLFLSYLDAVLPGQHPRRAPILVLLEGPGGRQEQGFTGLSIVCPSTDCQALRIRATACATCNACSKASMQEPC